MMPSVVADESRPSLEVLDSGNPRWQPLLEACDHINAFYRPEFVEAEARFLNGKAIMLVCRTSSGTAVYPCIELPVKSRDGPVYHDLRGLPYAGPASTALGSEAKKQTIETLWECLAERAEERGWVTDFCRLNPLLCSDPPQRVRTRAECSEHVMVDLEKSQETIFSGFNQTFRRNIRLALNQGVSCRICQTRAEFALFEELYIRRMRELGASSRFQYDDRYFSALRKVSGDSVFLVIAYLNNTLLGGALSLCHEQISLSFLVSFDRLFLMMKALKQLNLF